MPLAAQSREEVLELRRDSSDSREIYSGAVRVYEINLRANDYLRVLIIKGDLSLKATLLTGTGVKLGEFFNRRYGPLRVSFISPVTGLYRLELLSLETDTSVHRYDLRVEAIHKANARDRKDALASWSYAEAERLRTEWSVHSLRAAIEKYLTAARGWQSISDQRRALEALEALGETHFILGEYALSLRSYKNALQVSHAINPGSCRLSASRSGAPPTSAQRLKPSTTRAKYTTYSADLKSHSTRLRARLISGFNQAIAADRRLLTSISVTHTRTPATFRKRPTISGRLLRSGARSKIGAARRSRKPLWGRLTLSSAKDNWHSTRMSRHCESSVHMAISRVSLWRSTASGRSTKT